MDLTGKKNGTQRLVRRGTWQHMAWWAGGNAMPIAGGGDVAYYPPKPLR